MDKVLCPWCGREMELEHFVSENEDAEAFAYECHHCAAVLPVSFIAELALATALARPTQNPLTLEGVKERIAVWVEDRLRVMDNLVPALYVCNDEITYVFDKGFGEQDYHGKDNYGETWRCWATKPTDEERSAAKWNDE